METKQDIDLSITYNIREYPAIKSGCCDNCDKAPFKSSIKNNQYTERESKSWF